MKKLFSSVPRLDAASRFLVSLLMASFLVLACKTKPAPSLPEPSAFLAFNGVEANDPELLTLDYTLEIENPLPRAGRLTIDSWYAEINGQKAASGFNLADAENRGGISSSGYTITAAASANGEKQLPDSIPLKLNMDMAALAKADLAPADDYRVILYLNLNFTFDSSPPVKFRVSGPAQFPGVQPPVFTITSIAILKAELVITRFRVGLRIENPNPYAVELSAFGYELYGNGRPWADGMEKNIIKVPAKSFIEGNLFLTMNFINMKRDLLDQVANLIDVNYRFAGEAQVSTGAGYLPKFKTSFDLSGYSQVLDN